MQRIPRWDGQLANEGWDAAQKLADASKAGDWKQVMGLLESERSLHPNRWRPGGSSLYTPLHQAAWHGAPAEVVELLLKRGAFLALRTAKGQRACDIAGERGHTHLQDILEPPRHHSCDPETLPWLDLHLANLVESRIRPQLSAQLRHPSVELLFELPAGLLFYRIPGFYGGFSIWLRENHLYVESSSRIVWGSGQGHVVTRHGSVLVRTGFGG